MNRLVAYDWPGNIRELRNVLERAVIISPGARSSLDESFRRVGASLPRRPIRARSGRSTDVERDHILRVLDDCGWRVRGRGNAAQRLGLNASTLYSRMKKLKIQRTR